MADSLIPSWLLSALTGGLAGSLFTLLVGWLRSKSEAKKIRAQQIKALKEELRHARWLAEYKTMGGFEAQICHIKDLRI